MSDAMGCPIAQHFDALAQRAKARQYALIRNALDARKQFRALAPYRPYLAEAMQANARALWRLAGMEARLKREARGKAQRLGAV